MKQNSSDHESRFTNDSLGGNVKSSKLYCISLIENPIIHQKVAGNNYRQAEKSSFMYRANFLAQSINSPYA